MDPLTNYLGQISEITRRIGSSLEFDEAMKQVLRQVVTVLEMDSGVLVYEHQEEHPDAVVCYVRATDEFLNEAPNISRTVIQLVRQRSKTLLTPNIKNDPTLRGSDSVSGLGIVAGVPLRLGDSPMGVLYLESRGNGLELKASAQTAFLDAVADVVSLALANARTQTRMTAAVGISEQFGLALDVETVLASLLKTIVDLTRAEQGFLLLYDSDKDRLTVWGGRDRKGHSLAEMGQFFISTTLTEEVATTGKAVLSKNIFDEQGLDASQSIANFDLRSVLCVPVRSKGRVLGVLYLESRIVEAAFDIEDQRVVQLVADRAGMALDNARLFAQTREMVNALANAIEARDLTTSSHVQRVSQNAIAVGSRMGLSDADLGELEQSAMLHDIGKIGIPDAVLLKPGKLDTEEWATMKKHPQLGVRIVYPVGMSRAITAGILCHQEAYDGSGYPQGLSGKRIPVFGRIISVVDAFDAMVTRRPYKAGMPRADAIAELKRCRGVKFDPKVVDTFLTVLEEQAKEDE